MIASLKKKKKNKSDFRTSNHIKNSFNGKNFEEVGVEIKIPSLCKSSFDSLGRQAIKK